MEEIKFSSDLEGDRRLTDLNEEEKTSLHNYFLENVIPFAAKSAFKKMGGQRNSLMWSFEDIHSALSVEYCRILKKLESDENCGKRSDPYPLLAMINGAVFNSSRTLVTKFYNEVEEARRIRGNHHILVQEESSPADSPKLDEAIGDIMHIARKLKVKADEGDWVETIIACGRAPSPSKRLNKEELSLLTFYVSKLRDNGYIAESGKKPTKHGIITQLFKSMSEENPDTSIDDVIKELKRMGINAKERSVRVILSRHKKGDAAHDPSRVRFYGGVPAVSGAVRELWDEGVHDKEEMKAELRRRGIVFKPYVVYNYWRNLTRSGDIYRKGASVDKSSEG